MANRSKQHGQAKQRGQASVMIGIMMLTLLFFFAFVVNTGMLVNAKINLQNAADLAAYAGAAVQARQLTQISYLNYEMRRQYKKFLFRYYVLGNLSQCNFPGTRPNSGSCKFNSNASGGGTGKTPMIWSPDGNPANNYGTPVVCIIFNPKDNYCQISEIPEIKKAEGVSAFDDITAILNGFIDDINKIKNKNCAIVGKGNVLALHAWLWNIDPDFQLLTNGALDSLSSLSNPDDKELFKQVFSVVQGLGHGLGLVPRQVLLRQRVETLASYINTPAQKGLSIESVRGIKQQTIPEPPAFERSIQAFLSAYYTLGNHTFAADEIVMDEIMNDHLIKLGENTAKFDAFAIDFDNPQVTGNKCIPKATPDSVTTPIPVGVYKDPSFLTYYAVALKAKAQLMFSPFGSVQLTAYSAAQPFGSRIGPKQDPTLWLRTQRTRLQKTEGSPNSLGESIPNLPIRADDNAGPGNGWDTTEVMASMHQAFGRPDGTIPDTLSLPDLQRAYHVAMAPNVGEPRFYNIPYDADDPFVKNFDSSGILSFWAPVFPLTKLASMHSELEKLITQYWPDGNTVQQNAKEAMIKSIASYLGRLQQGDGEAYDHGKPTSREGFQIVRLADPLHTREDPTRMVSGSFTLTGGNGGGANLNQQLRTSWDDIRNSELEKGRIGYSVKFVSFQHLQSGKLQTTQAKDTLSNPLNADAEAQGDLPFIKH